MQKKEEYSFLRKDLQMPSVCAGIISSKLCTKRRSEEVGWLYFLWLYSNYYHLETSKPPLTESVGYTKSGKYSFLQVNPDVWQNSPIHQKMYFNTAEHPWAGNTRHKNRKRTTWEIQTCLVLMLMSHWLSNSQLKPKGNKYFYSSAKEYFSRIGCSHV